MNHPMLRCLAALIAAMTPLLADADPLRLKFAYFAADTDETWITTIRPFIEAVNEEAKGIIEIKPAIGSALAVQAQHVLDGTADMSFIVPGLTPARFPDNDILELPGLFADLREATLVATHLIAAGKLRGFEDYYVIGALGTMPASLHSRMQGTTLEDYAGKRVRASRAVEARVLQELGINPVSLPIVETSQALALGAIDGILMAPIPLVDYGVAKYVRYHYFPNLGGAVAALVMNRRVFDALPEAGQAAIRKYSGDWIAERYATGIAGFTEKILKDWRADPRQRLAGPSAEEALRLKAVYRIATKAAVAENPGAAELLAAVAAERAKLRKGPPGG
jgi:TRAP-type C4-dicarboxylate transport system substrate-binding protein